MHVALAQLDMAWEDKAENYKRLEAMLATAHKPPDLIAMPEMFATGFSMEAHRIAEDAEGETTAFLSALARRHKAFVVGTVVERGAHGGRNTCLVFARDGRLLSRYAKIHPFSFAGEDKHYEKGGELPIIDVEGFRVATPICYDLRFPELFRHGTRRGATLFIVPANWPAKRVFHWRHLLVARAIENLAWVIGVNRAGEGGGLQYPGSSLVVAPTGETLVEGGDTAALLEAEIDPSAVTTHREHFRFLDDFREDLFRV